MKIKNNIIKIFENLKTGFFKGVGIGLGLFTTSLFAAATAIKVFSAGDPLSSAMINKNFSIAAPEGAIIAFYLSSCPEGWASADGTNGTPDLRGLFVRGRDDIGSGAAGNDPSGSREIGNLQSDAFQGHYHSTLVDGVNGTSAGGLGNAINNGNDTASNVTRQPTTDGTNGTPRTANETRPKNIALTYCMRKN